ncbi:MAG: hypothetical protein IKJ01_01500 [Lachnospiraceae bacterium]|nr:hypothetical protein [Lachnospiraceae bacterium]
MKNKDLFKETFSKVSMSEDALKNLQNISKEEIDTQRIKPQLVTFRYSTVFALVALIIGFSSGIFIMNKEIKKIQRQQSREEMVHTTETDKQEDNIEQGNESEYIELRMNNYINGYYIDKEEVIFYVDENKVWHVEFKNNKMEPWALALPKDLILEHTSFIYRLGSYWKHGTPYGSQLRIGYIPINLQQEEKTIYFEWDCRKIDITEDFADGVATGICEIENEYTYLGEKYRYLIEGTLENYTAKIWILPDVLSQPLDRYLITEK